MLTCRACGWKGDDSEVLIRIIEGPDVIFTCPECGEINSMEEVKDE
jgi:uncharacterized Zn finger protein